MNNRFIIRILMVLLFGASVVVFATQNLKRNRGEIFHNCYNSNTVGPGDIWLSFSGVGHIWDDSPVETDTVSPETAQRRWVSNIRVFPEIKLQTGITDYLTVQGASRLVSYGFKPGFYSGGIKLTRPDNKELRMHGFGFAVDYRYTTQESAPSLGGYIGFMPEGFVVKGHAVETKFLYELDLISKISRLPVRAIANAGFRFPLSKRQELFQFLADIMVVYSGYNYDLYAGYSLESFTNFLSPVAVRQEGKKFLVWFSENPMYLNVGGNIRYDNGIVLSLTVPLLLSVNSGSRMRSEDMVELIHRADNGRFMYEKNRGIRDPFDPWFVKWKVAFTLTVPMRFTLTGAEMMRNYLLLKNRKEQKQIDIEKKIRAPDAADMEKDAPADTDEKRLEEIRKRRNAAGK